MWDNDETVIEQIAIIKCENGFGVETNTLHGEESLMKRYIAPTLEEAFVLARSYFKGELNG